MRLTLFLSLLILVVSFSHANADEQQSYAPAKVIYDVYSYSAIEMNHILDRANLLQKVYGNDTFDSSIIIVVHEGAIPFFSNNNKKHSELIQRANSLTLGEIIQFRLCLASARMQGYNENDFYDFINIVPMADAEIVQLQNKGYAYLR